MTLYKNIMPYFDKLIRLWLESEYIVVHLKNLDSQIILKLPILGTLFPNPG